MHNNWVKTISVIGLDLAFLATSPAPEGPKNDNNSKITCFAIIIL